jgi:glycosyltransferase involved in cell wall biosynthesis
VLSLTREIVRWRPRSVLSAMRHANALLVVATTLARLFGVRPKLVVSERGHMAALLATDPSQRAARAARLGGMLYQRADAIIAVSDDLAQHVREELGARCPAVVAIPNPTITEELLRQAAESPPHVWYGNPDIPVVVAAGRLSSEKGFDVLLEAFAHVARQRAARLIILGAGPLLEPLRAQAAHLQIAEHVQFPGFVPQLGAWLSHAQLFVLASRAEGLPNVLIQAMACGVPVVSTDCRTGPAEILEGGRWGTLVPVDDVDALSLAMQTVLGTRAPVLPAYVLERFHPSSVAAQYAAVLGIILDNAVSSTCVAERRAPGEITDTLA